MSSFLKKTNFAKQETTTTESKPKLGKSLGALNKPTLGKATDSPAKPSLLNKKKLQPKEIELEEETKPAIKPTLGKKSLLNKNKTDVKEEIDVTHCPEEGQQTQEDVIKFQEDTKPKEIELKETVEADKLVVKDSKDEVVTEIKEDIKKKATRKTTKKTTTKSKENKTDDKAEQQVLKAITVDETKRISLEEMDSIMRPIVAPTTEIWEQEKKDVLEALNVIKVEQDMNMSQVKSCLSDLDELKFEILPKHHDAETMYNGTKQNYDNVKAIAIANGSGGNAEARKAEGLLACKNFVTPSGEVVDLHQYMLLIEERQKFYEKVSDGVNFKKYSLVNYNNAIKAEKEGK